MMYVDAMTEVEMARCGSNHFNGRVRQKATGVSFHHTDIAIIAFQEYHEAPQQRIST